MAFAATQKFIREHLFELLITALISIGGAVGTYFLATIKGEIDQLECRVSEFGAANEFNTVQLKLIVTPLDDIKRNSDLLIGLDHVIDGYGKTLGLCSEGAKKLAAIENYKKGLDAYVDRNWDRAINSFELIPTRTALSEKSIASALLHKYFDFKAANNPKASEIEQQWRAKLASASDLASMESDYSAKEKAVEYLQCSRLLLDEDTAPAVQCLKDLVSSGQANYAVHYNLSALYARNGEFKDAVDQMELCMKSAGAQNQRRSDIEADQDFKKLLLDSSYGGTFKKLIHALQP